MRAVSSQTTWENQARVHAEIVKISQSEPVCWQPVVHLRHELIIVQLWYVQSDAENADYPSRWRRETT